MTDEEEDIMLATEPNLIFIRAISLLETIQSLKTTNVRIVDTNVKTSIKQGFEVQNT